MVESHYSKNCVQNIDPIGSFKEEFSGLNIVKKAIPNFSKCWEKLGLNQFFDRNASILIGMFFLMSFLLPLGLEGAIPKDEPGNSIAKFPRADLINAGGFENSYYVAISEIKKGDDHNVITSRLLIRMM